MADQELIHVLLRGFEAKDLDYKAAGEWNETGKKACCEIVKDILGMANTNGGFIVIGVSELASGFSWDGLTEEQAESWDTSRLNRFLQNYSDPPINALLRKILHDGKAFVVIEVPGFPDTPHICQKPFPEVLTAPTLYVRTDNNETAPIRSSADFRNIVESATRKRSDSLLTAFRSILVGGPQGAAAAAPSAREQFLEERARAVAAFEELDPLKDKGHNGYRDVCFFPERFEGVRLSLEQVRAAVQRGDVTFTGWPFLFVSRQSNETYMTQDGMETLASFQDFNGNDRCDFWRLQQSGFFYQRVLMWEESRRDRDGAKLTVADFGATALYAGEAVYCLTRLYEGLIADDEDFTLLMRMLGTKGRELRSFGRWGEFHGLTSRVDQIQVEQRHSLADWRAGIVEHAVEITKQVFLRFNWEDPNLGAIRDLIQKMFARKL